MHILKIKFFNDGNFYRARGQDASQEMEQKKATAELMVRLCSAWLLFSFSPVPVWHPAHEHSTYNIEVVFSIDELHR